MNLLKLVLPRFDGDLLQWTSFIDAFIAAVASDDNLGDVQKFQYMRRQLYDEAPHNIAGLPLSSDYYAKAMSLLKKCYGQSHKII